MKIGIFYFLPKRKKVRFTTAFGGAKGGANGCSKYPTLKERFSLKHNILHSVKTVLDSYFCQIKV